MVQIFKGHYSNDLEMHWSETHLLLSLGEWAAFSIRNTCRDIPVLNCYLHSLSLVYQFAESDEGDKIGERINSLLSKDWEC